jgi:hypothetical protein
MVQVQFDLTPLRPAQAGQRLEHGLVFLITEPRVLRVAAVGVGEVSGNPGIAFDPCLEMRRLARLEVIHKQEYQMSQTHALDSTTLRRSNS